MTSAGARWALIGALALLLALARAPRAWSRESQPPPSAGQLESYIAGVARAWEPYTTADGRVADPLNPGDTGDNYGVILLADVMLKIAARTGDGELEATGERILDSVLRLPAPADPFNLLAIAAVIHDGQDGEFPPHAWEALGGSLMLQAGEIGPPTAIDCLAEPGCYDNWRLVWSAGAALLLTDDVTGAPGSLAETSAPVAAQIKADLELAVTHAGAPLLTSVASAPPVNKPGAGARERSQHTRGASGADTRKGRGHDLNETSPALSTTGLGGLARELSDPGAEPSAYELFSAFMLELIGEADPGAIGPAVARLRSQTDRYALDMMAPDGQLSLAGRSLDQSWVQAAAAALGARRAVLEPANAAKWSAYADRAVTYLLRSYPLQPDGLLPILPGLALDWSPSIMDGYAALNQYEGLTLWLLSDALERWPLAQAPHAALPADGQSLLIDDLASSGLVWGRAGDLWWQLSGHSTSGDPRAAQGLVAVKVANGGDWRDLLALRPIRHGHSSVWKLGLARGATATPTFEQVRGTGSGAVLSGVYRRAGHVVAGVTWTLRTTARGLRLSMSVPAKDTLRTTVWLAATGARLSAPGATRTPEKCLVSASGWACPVTVSWRGQRTATLEVAAAGTP
jgi:hypothetical protein